MMLLNDILISSSQLSYDIYERLYLINYAIDYTKKIENINVAKLLS